MTTWRIRILTGVLAVAFAMIAAAIWLLVASNRGSSLTATNQQVVQRAQSAEAQLAAALGPNTTFHESVLDHLTTSEAALNDQPADQASEGWWGSDSAGKLVAYTGETRSVIDGSVIETQVLSGTTLTITEFPSGKTTQFKNYTPAASVIASNISSAINNAKTQLNASGIARAQVVGGNYVLATPQERDYIDPTTYLLTKTEEILPDGSTGEVKTFVAIEVLNGNAVPTPPAGARTLPTPAASTPLAAASATPAPASAPTP